MTRYVIDSYAVLAVWRHEAARPRVIELLADTAHLHWMSVINIGEAFYRTAREEDFPSAGRMLKWIESYDVRFINVTYATAISAASIKARYALSYADCFAAALAQQVDGTILTGDPEFEPLVRDDIVRVEWLPRARGRRR